MAIFRFRIYATSCNKRKPSRRGKCAALAAVAAHLQAAHDNVEAAVALDLSLEAIEEIAFELRDLPATQAGHVDVIALRATLDLQISCNYYTILDSERAKSAESLAWTQATGCFTYRVREQTPIVG